jgi:hypothetical protein
MRQRIVSSTSALVALLFLNFSSFPSSDAWMPSSHRSFSQPTRLHVQTNHDQQHPPPEKPAEVASISRRTALHTSLITTTATAALLLFGPVPSHALVKGVAPPPPRRSSGGGDDRPRCTNVEECQALAERREAELRASEEAGPPPMVTNKGGVKYRDLDVGQGGGVTVENGDQVDLYFKVLKLGKRSYDGLSGEGTVVFSRGYGLEDDEDRPGVRSFQTVVGNTANIEALNDALVGMKMDGIRRFAIYPQKGWEKATAACDGGPGGKGAGGNLKTDYVVVPTATMVEQEFCFDKTKLPFPATYAQQRRMAQRFDQSLIMEVRVVGINKDSKMAL